MLDKFVMHGNYRQSPTEIFKQMAIWCEENKIDHDIYGNGNAIQHFEQKIADLLGFEAGLFVVTGTLAQATALQLACADRGVHNVGMHQSSHIYLREKQGYQLQNRFNALPIGEPYCIWSMDDLTKISDPLAAVIYELPMREIGGQLPSISQLDDIKQYCKKRNIHFHLDGARLWETKAYYNKTYSDICRGFDTAYVSLYKGVNGLGGAMLLGRKDFIKRNSDWMDRQGGNVYNRTPYVVSALMQFDKRLDNMPALFDATVELYNLLDKFDNLTPNPEQPQSNMLHVYLPLSQSKAEKLRDKLAAEYRIFIGNPKQGLLANQSYLEWYVGDYILNMGVNKLRQVLSTINELSHPEIN